MITTDKTQLNINVLTQEQYEQAKADETLDADSLYMVDDDIHQMGVELDFEGVEKRILLWTNPNPTAQFAGQTLPLNLSGYEYVEIVFLNYNSQSTYGSSKVSVGENCFLVNALGSVDESEGYIWVGQRKVLTSVQNIVFMDAKRATATPSQFAVNNNNCIPHKIYGIKKLQPSYNVIPQQVDYVVDNNNGRRVWKSGKVDDYNEYFTEEKVVGKWIDGKPIYRITLTGTLDAAGSRDINVPSLHIDNLINAYGYSTTIYGHKWQIPASYSDTGYCCSCFVSPIQNPTLLTIGGGTYRRDCPFVITIEYTKTTD